MIQLFDCGMLVAVSGYLDDEEVYRLSMVGYISIDLQDDQE
jgi:hypothetical protein